jgi:hypothetical protein
MPRAKFGKETVARAHRGQNGFYIMVRRLTQGVLRILRLAQAPLRLCSGMLTLGSGMLPLAQVKAAVAHIYRLKRKQRKEKLILSLWVFTSSY